MQRYRNVAHGQWKGALFFFHFRTTCWIWGNRPNWSGGGIELLTPFHWFRIRRGRYERNTHG